MAVQFVPGSGFQSVKPPTSGDVLKSAIEKVTGKTVVITKSGGSKQSTRSSPTPSASTLTGTAQQREQQIQEFRAEQKAGTIAGQQQVMTGGVVEAPRSTQEQIESVFNRPTRDTRFSLDLLKKAGREFFFVEGTPLQALGTLASPFQSLFPETRGEVKTTPVELLTGRTIKAGGIQKTIFGLIKPEVLVSEEDVLKRELQIRPEALDPIEARAEQLASKIQQDITPALQAQVTSGEITVKQAEEQFQEQFQPEFERRSTEEFKETTKLKGAVQRSLEPSFNIERTAELAGVFAASTTPVGLALAGGSLVARGTEKILTEPTLGGKALGLGEAGIGLVIGGSSVILAEQLADKALVEELLAQRGRVTGREVFREGDQSLFRITSERKLGSSASLKTELLSPTFKTGEKTFSVTGGGGVSKLDFFSLETGGRKVFIETFGFGAQQSLKGAAPRIVSGGAKITLADLQATTGRGFVFRTGEDVFTQFNFGGVSQITKTPSGQIVKIDAGQVTGLRLSNLGGFAPVPGVKIPIRESGFIKLLSQDIGGGGVVTSSGGLKTSFQQTFSSGGLATGIEKVLFKTPSPSGLSAGFAGVATKTIIDIKPSRGGGFTQQVKIDLKSDQSFDTKQIVIQSPQLTQLPKSRSRQLVVPISAQSPALAQQQRQGLIPRLDLVQRQALLPKAAFVPFIPTPQVAFAGFGGGFGFILPPFPSLGGGAGKIKKKTGKRKRRKIAPGLTGIIVGGVGLPKPGAFGISPFQLRGIPATRF